jgi:hypothetical protein
VRAFAGARGMSLSISMTPMTDGFGMLSSEFGPLKPLSVLRLAVGVKEGRAYEDGGLVLGLRETAGRLKLKGGLKGED